MSIGDKEKPILDLVEKAGRSSYWLPPSSLNDATDEQEDLTNVTRLGTSTRLARDGNASGHGRGPRQKRGEEQHYAEFLHNRVRRTIRFSGGAERRPLQAAVKRSPCFPWTSAKESSLALHRGLELRPTLDKRSCANARQFARLDLV